MADLRSGSAQTRRSTSSQRSSNSPTLATGTRDASKSRLGCAASLSRSQQPSSRPQPLARCDKETTARQRRLTIDLGPWCCPTASSDPDEVLAARLAGATPLFASRSLPRLIPRSLRSSTGSRRGGLSRPDGPVEVTDYILTLTGASGPVPLEILGPTPGIGSHVQVLPAASLVILRDDLASVMSREEPGSDTSWRFGRVRASQRLQPGGHAHETGGALGQGWCSRSGCEPRPSGSGVPVVRRPHLSGQLAGRLADAGYFVLRYDARGVGQTGGRTESAGIAEYAEDAIAAVTWLRKRSDVDANRIALLGYWGRLARLRFRPPRVRRT